MCVAVRMRRVVPESRQLFRRAVEDDALAHEHDPLHHVLDGAELMRDVEGRDAELVAQPLQQLAERLLGACGTSSA